MKDSACGEGGGNGSTGSHLWSGSRGDDAITTRLGAAALPIGVVLTAIFEVFFHPQREDPMDNPAVFMEYANSESWTAVHLGQYFGFLLILGGLIALYYSVSAQPGMGAGLAPSAWRRPRRLRPPTRCCRPSTA
jgi:hypothetical protein